jgi:hypothetical protein
MRIKNYWVKYGDQEWFVWANSRSDAKARIQEKLGDWEIEETEEEMEVLDD